MAIERLSSRPDVNGTAADPKSAAPSIPAKSANAVHASAPDGGMLDAPASTSRLAAGALILGLMQLYETLHPDQAKALLQSIADKLHADAASAGASSASLKLWGDKFQLAAESGDLSKLMRSMLPSPHFGIRAYQAAQQVPDDADTIATVFRNSAPPTSVEDLATVTTRLLDTVSDSIRALGPLKTVDPGVADELARAPSTSATDIIHAANEAAGNAAPSEEANPSVARGRGEYAGNYAFLLPDQLHDHRRAARQRRRRRRRSQRKYSHSR